MKLADLIFLILIISIFTVGQTIEKYPEHVKKRIQKVEEGIPTRIRKEKDSLWSLVDRMNYYNINGLSISVIKNYKIEWAKGYGWADLKEKRAVTTSTLFQAGSISKNIHAALSFCQQIE